MVLSSGISIILKKNRFDQWLTDFVGYGTIKEPSKVLKGKKLGAVICNGG